MIFELISNNSRIQAWARSGVCFPAILASMFARHRRGSYLALSSRPSLPDIGTGHAKSEQQHFDAMKCRYVSQKGMAESVVGFYAHRFLEHHKLSGWLCSS